MSARPGERGGRFRVLVGKHIGDGPPGCTCTSCAGGAGGPRNHIYRARRETDPAGYVGDIIDSPVDLVKRFNHGPFSRKFERLPDVEPAAASDKKGK